MTTQPPSAELSQVALGLASITAPLREQLAGLRNGAAATAALRRGGGPLWALLFMAVGFEFFLLARSSRVVAPSLQGSKFALIVGLQLLLLIVGALEGRVTEEGDGDLPTAAPRGAGPAGR